MGAICEFFQGIQTDYEIINAETDPSEEIRNDRVGSVASRIFGVVLVGTAGFTFIAAVITLATAPAAGILLLVCSLFVAVIAHDMIIVGCNVSKELALLHNPSRDDQDLLQRGLQFIRNAAHVGGMVAGEFQNDVPYRMHGTLIIGPLYNLCPE
jgi:hypothetical protein